MSEGKKVQTNLRFEGGRAVSNVEGHPSIALAGLGKMDVTLDAWSPPHLLVAAAEACFLLTALRIAEKMRIGISSYTSTAEGVVSSEDGKHSEISEIIVRPIFHFTNEEDRKRLPELSRLASEHCLVERSLKTKVRVEWEA